MLKLILPPCSTRYLYFSGLRPFRRNIRRMSLLFLARSKAISSRASATASWVSLNFLSNSASSIRQRINVERSEEHTSELQSRENLVCRLRLENKNRNV